MTALEHKRLSEFLTGLEQLICQTRVSLEATPDGLKPVFLDPNIPLPLVEASTYDSSEYISIQTKHVKAEQ